MPNVQSRIVCVIVEELECFSNLLASQKLSIKATTASLKPNREWTCQGRLHLQCNKLQIDGSLTLQRQAIVKCCNVVIGRGVEMQGTYVRILDFACFANERLIRILESSKNFTIASRRHGSKLVSCGEITSAAETSIFEADVQHWTGALVARKLQFKFKEQLEITSSVKCSQQLRVNVARLDIHSKTGSRVTISGVVDVSGGPVLITAPASSAKAEHLVTIGGTIACQRLMASQLHVYVCTGASILLESRRGKSLLNTGHPVLSAHSLTTESKSQLLALAGYPSLNLSNGQLVFETFLNITSSMCHCGVIDSAGSDQDGMIRLIDLELPCDGSGLDEPLIVNRLRIRARNLQWQGTCSGFSEISLEVADSLEINSRLDSAVARFSVLGIHGGSAIVNECIRSDTLAFSGLESLMISASGHCVAGKMFSAEMTDGALINNGLISSAGSLDIAAGVVVNDAGTIASNNGIISITISGKDAVQIGGMLLSRQGISLTSSSAPVFAVDCICASGIECSGQETPESVQISAQRGSLHINRSIPAAKISLSSFAALHLADSVSLQSQELTIFFQDDSDAIDAPYRIEIGSGALIDCPAMTINVANSKRRLEIRVLDGSIEGSIVTTLISTNAHSLAICGQASVSATPLPQSTTKDAEGSCQPTNVSEPLDLQKQSPPHVCRMSCEDFDCRGILTISPSTMLAINSTGNCKVSGTLKLADRSTLKISASCCHIEGSVIKAQEATSSYISIDASWLVLLGCIIDVSVIEAKTCFFLMRSPAVQMKNNMTKAMRKATRKFLAKLQKTFSPQQNGISGKLSAGASKVETSKSTSQKGVVRRTDCGCSITCERLTVKSKAIAAFLGCSIQASALISVNSSVIFQGLTYLNAKEIRLLGLACLSLLSCHVAVYENVMAALNIDASLSLPKWPFSVEFLKSNLPSLLFAIMRTAVKFVPAGIYAKIFQGILMALSCVLQGIGFFRGCKSAYLLGCRLRREGWKAFDINDLIEVIASALGIALSAYCIGQTACAMAMLPSSGPVGASTAISSKTEAALTASRDLGFSFLGAQTTRATLVNLNSGLIAGQNYREFSVVSANTGLVLTAGTYSATVAAQYVNHGYIASCGDLAVSAGRIEALGQTSLFGNITAIARGGVAMSDTRAHSNITAISDNSSVTMTGQNSSHNTTLLAKEEIHASGVNAKGDITAISENASVTMGGQNVSHNTTVLAKGKINASGVNAKGTFTANSMAGNIVVAGEVAAQNANFKGNLVTLDSVGQKKFNSLCVRTKQFTGTDIDGLYRRAANARELQVNKMSLSTERDVSVNLGGYAACDFELVAASVTTHRSVYHRGALNLVATKGDVNVRQDLVASSIGISSVAGAVRLNRGVDLRANRGDLSVYSHDDMLLNHNILSAAGNAIICGSGKLDMVASNVHAECGFAQMEFKGSISQRMDADTHTASALSGNDAVYIITQDRYENIASNVNSAEGDIMIHADMGVSVRPQVEQEREEVELSEWWGLKTTTIEKLTEKVYGSELHAQRGKIVINAPEGPVDLQSADIQHASGFAAHGHGVSLTDYVARNETTTETNVLGGSLYHSRHHVTAECSVPLTLRGGGLTQLHAADGTDVLLQGADIEADMLLLEGNKVIMKGRTLNQTVEHEESGFFASIDSDIGHVSDAVRAHNNAKSAMATAATDLTYSGPLFARDAQDAYSTAANLSSGNAAPVQAAAADRVRFGYRNNRSAAHTQHLAENAGVEANSLVVNANEFDIANGAQVSVAQDAYARADVVNVEGARLHNDETQEHFEVSLSGFGDNGNLSVTASQANATANAEIVQQAHFTVGGRLHFDNVRELNQRGGNLSAGELTGTIGVWHHGSLTSSQTSSGSRFSLTYCPGTPELSSVSGQASAEHREFIAEPSHTYVLEGIDATRLHVGLYSSRGAILASEGRIDPAFADHLQAESIHVESEEVSTHVAVGVPSAGNGVYGHSHAKSETEYRASIVSGTSSSSEFQTASFNTRPENYASTAITVDHSLTLGIPARLILQGIANIANGAGASVEDVAAARESHSLPAELSRLAYEFDEQHSPEEVLRAAQHDPSYHHLQNVEVDAELSSANATVFRVADEHGQHIYVAFPGTHSFEGHGAQQAAADWANDGAVLLTGRTFTYPTDVLLVDEVRAKYPNERITLTGHSQGGTRALTAADELHADDIDTHTFNPGYGLPSIGQRPSHGHSATSNNQSYAHRTNGDVVSAFGPFSDTYANQVHIMDPQTASSAHAMANWPQAGPAMTAARGIPRDGTGRDEILVAQNPAGYRGAYSGEEPT